jgi:signal transduction histidine kinase
VSDQASQSRLFGPIDWFVPVSMRYERSELSLARNFVFTHLFGPLISQSILLFLYWSDPRGGWPMWTICICVWSFWALPFFLKYTGNLYMTALISVELLAFTSLFGAFFYGGASSPFLPWLIISLLLGFFYLSKRPYTVILMFANNLCLFFTAYLIFGFAERVPRDQLATVGWISIFSATVYMAWMAVYYAGMLSARSDLVRETEQHRETMLRLLEAKKQADEANRSRSIFLAKMSHEFRTPLNAVIGYSEIVMETLENEDSNPQKKKDLQSINAAGKHLLSLLTDVLDLSRIENDEIDVSVQTVDLNQFIEDVVSNTRQLVIENRNRLVIDCAPRLGTISTDVTKLRQAALNLIGNAAKFTKAGTVTLSVRRERSAVGDWIAIQVIDSGIGIASHDLAKLFTNFRQASASTASKFGGTGLGLAHSQKLCGLMGGRITVTSEPGKGSIFTIRVPASIEVVRNHSTVLIPAPAGAVAAGA